MCCFIRLALAASHIPLDKGDHPLGMPSDSRNFALLMNLPSHPILRESVR